MKRRGSVVKGKHGSKELKEETVRVRIKGGGRGVNSE